MALLISGRVTWSQSRIWGKKWKLFSILILHKGHTLLLIKLKLRRCAFRELRPIPRLRECWTELGPAILLHNWINIKVWEKNAHYELFANDDLWNSCIVWFWRISKSKIHNIICCRIVANCSGNFVLLVSTKVLVLEFWNFVNLNCNEPFMSLIRNPIEANILKATLTKCLLISSNLCLIFISMFLTEEPFWVIKM